MADVTVRALQTFSSLGGRVTRGSTVTVNRERAEHLVKTGLAVRVPGPTSTQAEARPKKPVVKPTEANAEIKAVGGGWYEWRGKRYRGKKAAEEAKEREG